MIFKIVVDTLEICCEGKIAFLLDVATPPVVIDKSNESIAQPLL
jgi:hypothetical protein